MYIRCHILENHRAIARKLNPSRSVPPAKTMFFRRMLVQIGASGDVQHTNPPRIGFSSNS